MRFYLTIAILTIASCLCSPASRAQSSTRSLTVSLDTLTRNTCDDKSFLIPIRSGDIYFADSVYGFTVTVYWDRSKLELDNIIGYGDNTIVRNRPSTIVMASKDPQEGILYIEVADTSLNLIAGQNKPLLYLSGNITDSDTVDGLNGWIRVNQIKFEGPPNKFGPITYLPGFVHVMQDTTAAFTGRLSVSGAAFDTLRADTIELTVGNVAKRKVSEISFSMKAAPGFYSFIDTLQSGTLGSLVNWSEKEVRITPDSISARFVASGELQLQGPLLKVVLRRDTDSAFDQPVSITRFEINQESCLGRLTTENARITALAIPGDSTPSGVEYRPTIMEQEVAVIPQVSNGAVVVQAENIDIQEVRVFDGLGRLVPLPSISHSGRGRILIQMPSGIASGVYFLELRSQHTIIYKQIRLIQ